MNENTFEEIKTNVAEKATAMWNSAKQGVSDAIQWGMEHPTEVVAIISVSAAVLKASQSLVVSHRVKAERARIDHTYYDPSTGMHWDLCRKANNNDRAMIMQRKANGEDVYSILRDLRLIK